MSGFSSFLACFGQVSAGSCHLCQENPRTGRGQSRESKNRPRTKPRKKIRTDAYNKTNISKLCSSKLLSLSQPSLLQKLWAAVLPPRGASIRRPSGDGVLDDWFQLSGLVLKVPDLKVLESERPAFPPPKSSPGGCAFRRADSKFCRRLRSWRSWAEKMTFQEAFKISSFFASTFLSIWAPSWPPT